jgi:hypothetical protein
MPESVQERIRLADEPKPRRGGSPYEYTSHPAGPPGPASIGKLGLEWFPLHLSIAAKDRGSFATTEGHVVGFIPAIAAELNERGIQAPRGTGKWKAGSVAQLLARLPAP